MSKFVIKFKPSWYLVFFLVMCPLLFLVFAHQLMSHADHYGDENNGHYAQVNGISMYYEIYGEGDNLILIHGNGDSIWHMRYQIDYFSRHYRVIAADSRGHGKSGAGDTALTYEQIAYDWAALLDQLQIDSTMVLGWSDGGIVGLLLAIHFPAKVKKLAAMGANLQPDTSAVYSWAVDWVARETARTDSLIAKNDSSKNWPLIKQYLGLLGQQPHIPLADLHTIAAPVLVLAGDSDVIREEHTILIYQNIPKAQLCIFPGETHMVPVENPQLFNQTVYRFFKEPFQRPDMKTYFE